MFSTSAVIKVMIEDFGIEVFCNNWMICYLQNLEDKIVTVSILKILAE